MTLLADMATDIDVMYDADLGFAESVDGPSGAVLAIFDNDYFEGDPGGTVHVMSSEPAFRTRDSDAMAKGDSVTIRTTGYTVVEVMPDGNGETLHRVQAT